MPKISRESINTNNDDVQYETLKACHSKYTRDNDTHKDSLSFLIRSTVAIQHEDGGPWMHGVIKGTNNSYHNWRSYIVRVTKTGRLIILNTRHIGNTTITIEQHLWEQIRKGN